MILWVHDRLSSMSGLLVELPTVGFRFSPAVMPCLPAGKRVTNR